MFYRRCQLHSRPQEYREAACLNASLVWVMQGGAMQGGGNAGWVMTASNDRDYCQD